MGTLIRVGEEKIDPQEVKKILESKNRSKAHVTAQAHGLFLIKVFYKKEAMEKFQLKELPFYSD